VTTRGLYKDRPRPARPPEAPPTDREIARRALSKIFDMLQGRERDTLKRSQLMGVQVHRFSPGERLGYLWRNDPVTFTAFWETHDGSLVSSAPQDSEEHALDVAGIMLASGGFRPPGVCWVARRQSRPWLELYRECGGWHYTGWRAALHQVAAQGSGQQPSSEAAQ